MSEKQKDSIDGKALAIGVLGGTLGHSVVEGGSVHGLYRAIDKLSKKPLDAKIKKGDAEALKKILKVPDNIGISRNEDELYNSAIKGFEKLKKSMGKAGERMDPKKHAADYTKMQGGGSHFNPLLKNIHIADGEGTGKFVLAHEMSHSKRMSLPYGIVSGATKTMTPIASGYGVYKGVSGDKLEGKDMAEMIAPSALQLTEETRANIDATRAIKKLDGWKGLGKSKKALAMSQGGYMLSALSPFMAYGLARAGRGIYDKIQKKKDKK